MTAQPVPPATDTRTLSPLPPLPVVALTAATGPDRCLRHSWERRGGATYDNEDPTYFRCRVCRIDADEIEHELIEAHEQIAALTTDVNRETERADRADAATKDALMRALNTRRAFALFHDELMSITITYRGEKVSLLELYQDHEAGEDA